MKRHKMRLVGANGDTDRAWFDASAISPEYHGVRCALAIGEEGGVVCTAVESRLKLVDMSLRQVATDAVVATEMTTIEGQPQIALIDDEGGNVVLDKGDDDTPPIDHDVVQAPTEELTYLCEKLPAPIGVLATAIAMSVVVIMCITLIDMPPMLQILLATIPVLGIIAIGFTLKAWRCKIYIDRMVNEAEGIVAREFERRRLLNELIAKNAH